MNSDPRGSCRPSAFQESAAAVPRKRNTDATQSTTKTTHEASAPRNTRRQLMLHMPILLRRGPRIAAAQSCGKIATFELLPREAAPGARLLRNAAARGPALDDARRVS